MFGWAGVEGSCLLFDADAAVQIGLDLQSCPAAKSRAMRRERICGAIDAAVLR
jgi:hypothetical protein